MPTPLNPLPASTSRLRVSPGWVTAACDGSCQPNPGPGGWAFVLAGGGWAAGGEQATTNNRMELVALEQLLRHVGPDHDLEVRLDSQLVLQSMTKWRHGWAQRGWRKADGSPVANADVVQRLHALLEERTAQTRFVWVKAHQARGGDVLNEAADARAQQATKRARRGDVAPVTGSGW